MKKKKNILICPLEWGLGHTGRMIALAEKLQHPDRNIIFGAGEKHLAFIRKELPGAGCLSFPGFRPVYSRYLPQYIIIFFQIPLLLFHVIREHIILKKMIVRHSLDMVISDNRFGLWNKKITSVYVTHQLRILFPSCLSFLEFTGIHLHRKIIRRFTWCLVPDLPGEINLTGKMSHGMKLPSNVRFTGILSRFQPYGPTDDNPVRKKGIICVILSGPEPQRGVLERKITAMLAEENRQTMILGGKPQEGMQKKITGPITYYSYAGRREMQEIIAGSELIIARAGYTTIMELISLNCRALLIPTPGQTEQEYLASKLAEEGWFACMPQKNLKAPLPSGSELPDRKDDDIMKQSRELFDKVLKEISDETEV
ncbi:MAG: hypothetical protein GX876_02065 [Bacteroidales bacterium]|nr:hypothetical protein [Bacteroidales bacterium]